MPGMQIFIFKLLLTPLLIAGTTWISRRWGPAIGGCVTALPLSGGPITFFIALEQGPDFGLAAAGSSLLGMAAVVVFCSAYSCSARRFSWVPALTFSLGAYFLTIEILSLLAVSLAVAALAVLIMLTLATRINGNCQAGILKMVAPWWDMPARMAAATGLLFLLTALASVLGPRLSGLLAVFPVFTCVMTVFTHKQYGTVAIRQFLRGILLGCYASVAFFLVINLAMLRFSLPVVYLLASMICIGISFAMLKTAVR